MIQCIYIKQMLLQCVKLRHAKRDLFVFLFFFRIAILNALKQANIVLL